MSEISSLLPAAVWKFFDIICSIPHPSGHEAALADKLSDIAAEHHLAVRRDAAGNIRIDRQAAPGFENAPQVILQGHLDMVPESDHPFDFLNCAVSPRVDGDWVTACGTTLGADNGISVAHAMALLCDPELRCGALAGVFTVQEETGMHGAAALAPEFLAGDLLLNCDNGSRRSFSIGCAGGARQSFTFEPQWESAAVDAAGIKLHLAGLPGGHSGTCIHLERGNAIRFLAEFLDMHPEISLCAIDAGKVDNAIPAEAVAIGASSLSIARIRELADAFTVELKSLCPNASGVTLTVSEAPPPLRVWSAEFRERLVAALALVPDGVLEYSDEFDAVRDSSNLAIVRSDEQQVQVSTSQRSLADAERDRICDLIAAHFANFGASGTKSSVYPATTPKAASRFQHLALQIREKMGSPAELTVIHAGLESGWFSLKNPDLEIISCGPYIEACHQPVERLEIESVQQFDRFLRLLLAEIAQLQA